MKLGELASRVNGILEGDGALDITGVAGLAEAGPGDLSFLANSRYASAVARTRACAVLVPADWKGDCPCAQIRVQNPDWAFAEAARAFAPPPDAFPPGIHPSAVIATDALLGRDVHVGPGCVLESGAHVGDRCVLVAHCFIGRHARLGDDCRLYARVSVRTGCVLGCRVTVHDGAVIGSDGFGYAPDADGVWQKIIQQGTVEIGDDVEIGANTTLDRARVGKTRIGNGVKIDNLVQIAHNVQVGDHTVMAAQVGISGSTIIGRHVRIGGQAGLAGHLHIGDGAGIGAQAGVTKDVPPGRFVSGYPAMDHRQATRAHAGLMRLPALKEQVRALAAKLEDLGRERKP